MEEKTSFSITLTENEKPQERPDPLAPTYPTWSTRWKCCQIFFCLCMNFESLLAFSTSLTDYGFVIFLPYLVFTVFLGAPAVLMEIMFGRIGGGSILRTWSMCPPARGLFICLFITTCLLVIQGHFENIFILKYFFSCFYGKIPWSDCNGAWAKDNCYVYDKLTEAYLRCLSKYSKEYCDSLEWETTAIQYWKYAILEEDGFGILWTYTYLLISVLIILPMVFKGIYSLEKTVSLLVYLIFALYALLTIASLSIPGVVQAFLDLSVFGWDRIGSIELWISGFYDMLYSTCVGTLSLSFISGHGKFTDNIVVDLFIVTFMGIISSLLFTVPLLCAIKTVMNMDNSRNFLFHDADDVLILISEALLLFPPPKVMWAALYFLTVFFLSISSQAIMVLAISEALQNIFRKKSMNFWVMIVSAVSFVLTALVHYLSILYFISEIALTVNLTLGTLTWQLFYGIDNFKNDFYFMMGYPVPFTIRCTWFTLFILPIAIISLIFYDEKDTFFHLLFFFWCAFLVAIYIFNILFYMLKTKRNKGNILTVFTVNPDWGPENPILKKSRKLFGVSSVTREFIYRQELNKKPLMKPPEFSQQNIVNLVTIY